MNDKEKLEAIKEVFDGWGKIIGETIRSESYYGNNPIYDKHKVAIVHAILNGRFSKANWKLFSKIGMYHLDDFLASANPRKDKVLCKDCRKECIDRFSKEKGLCSDHRPQQDPKTREQYEKYSDEK